MAKTPMESNKPSAVSSFLTQTKKHPLARAGANRLIFALDATASREPTWDLAASIHTELFNTADQAQLSVQLVYYRGYNEFVVSSWSTTARSLLDKMQTVRCRGGITQIARLLGHIRHEAQEDKLKGAVFIGDMCEENSEEILDISGQLGLLRVPVFVFQEGNNGYANQVFSGIALRSGGAHVPFTPGSASELSDLLGAVAVYASQGKKGMERLRSRGAINLLTQLKKQ